MNHIRWEHINAHLGPPCDYGYWEDAKCFNIFGTNNGKGHTLYQINCSLPGFRKDLPLQNSVEEAKAFAERMLTRWVAKRGLLFKGHIVVTDAMKEAGWQTYQANESDGMDLIENVIKSALAARG